MNGIWILLLLILTATLPAIIVFLWMMARKSPVNLPWFLLALAAGSISLLVAGFIQRLIPFPPGNREMGWVFFSIFVRIALVEETSRIVTLVPLLKLGARRSADQSFAASLGLAAGLGFAAIENAFYGAADINITLLRVFTAAPLHAACGIRTGTAVFLFRRSPAKAVFLFITAVLIHGAYNLIIISPAFPSSLSVRTVIVVLFAFAVLVTALPNIMLSREDEK